jgi:hypothetical protein
MNKCSIFCIRIQMLRAAIFWIEVNNYRMTDKWCCDRILLNRQPSCEQMAWEVIICTDVANKKRQESKKAMGVKIGMQGCEIQMRGGMV